MILRVAVLQNKDTNAESELLKIQQKVCVGLFVAARRYLLFDKRYAEGKKSVPTAVNARGGICCLERRRDTICGKLTRFCRNLMLLCSSNLNLMCGMKKKKSIQKKCGFKQNQNYHNNESCGGKWKSHIFTISNVSKEVRGKKCKEAE